VVQFDPMTIDIRNVRALLRIMNHKHAKMVMQLPNKQAHTLTAEQIKMQLMQKMIPGIQDASLIYQWIKTWENRKILSGQVKSSYTKHASFQFNEASVSKHAAFNKFSIFLLIAKDTVAEYRYQRVQGAHQDELPKFENADCEPFNRETVFSRYDNAFRKPSPPIRYRPALFDTITREFTLYFDHNSFTYTKDKVQPLIDYLAQSDHQLSSVTISSYSSIEGDSANNMLLMRKRGEILKEIVSNLPYKIPEISLHEAENWLLFEEQIDAQNLRALANSAWKKKLEDNIIADSFEHLLKKQRYAKIKFSLVRPKTREELSKALDQQTLRLWTAFGYFFNKKSNRKRAYYHLDLTDPNLVFIIRKMVGLLYYAQKEGFVEQAFINTYFESDIMGSLGAEIMVYLFYQPGRFHLGIPKEDLLLSVFNTAKTRIVALKDSPQNHKIFNDVQKIIFKQVAKGRLSSGIIEKMVYPSHPSIDPYQAYYLFKKQEFIENGILKDTSFTELNESEQQNGSKRFLNAEYYIFLKNLVIENTLALLPNTTIQRSDWFLPFDQYELLWYQNAYWDVHNDKRFDPDINIATQLQLLRRLIKKPGNLCSYSIEHLAVDFFHKLLIHADRHHNKEYAREAANYLMAYYEKNDKYLIASELQQITSQLYSINRYLYYGQIGQWAEELKEDMPKSNRTSHL